MTAGRRVCAAVALSILASGLACATPAATKAKCWKHLNAGLTDRDALKRMDAARLHVAVRTPDARKRLSLLVAKHPDADVRRAAVEAMAGHGHAAWSKLLVAATADKDWWVRDTALEGLQGSRDPAAEKAARRSMTERLATGGGAQYQKYPVPEALLLAAAGATGATAEVAKAAQAVCTGAGQTGGALQACISLWVAAWRLGDASFRAPLTAAAKHRDKFIRQRVAYDLRVNPSSDATSMLVTALGDTAHHVRWVAAESLTGRSDSTVLAALDKVATTDAKPHVRYAAALTLPKTRVPATNMLAAVVDAAGLTRYEQLRVASELARRGRDAGFARLEKIFGASDRHASPPRRRYLHSRYPIVHFVAEVPGSKAEALLRKIRDAGGEEGVAASLALARRGDLKASPHHAQALEGKRGRDSQLLAAAACAAGVKERLTARCVAAKRLRHAPRPSL